MHLQDKISSLPYISEYYSKKLNKLNIFTVKDLLTYFPRKYEDSTEILTIQQVLLDDTKLDTKIQLKVFFEDIKNIRLKSQKSIQKGIAYDKSGKLECIWFNQPYLLNFINPETEYMIIGKFTKNKSKFVLYPTTIEALKPEKDLVHTARITPKYSLTSGISEKWFRNRMKFLVENISSVEMPRDFEAIEITQEYIKKALKNIHFPENYDALEESINLLSLIELIQIQLKLENNRAKFKKHKAIEINPKSFMEQEKLINELPFKLTKDQMEAIQNLNSQMMQKDIINALIQGDVGSGKTIVSIAISIPVILSGYQVIFLAPTTILAEQQYKNFQTFLKNFNLSINLVTGKTKKQQQADILIGTTAVLARKQNLINKPGLVIVDEQHRFGVNQREDLLSPFTSILNKKEFPHFINMSATPIPRTIAQTMFGDVSVIEIKSKPTNRKPIKTFITPHKQANGFTQLAQQRKLHKTKLKRTGFVR
ncbi:MAG: hypothetical protein KatS3mg085_409 [Candidatus Dojkabacteria bacterium]|nr:MAG: hypothetical protein KatS3mg085_409 [Candidatus Dojkabacteria bacterium]